MRALLLAAFAAVLPTQLALAPWHGPDLPTVTKPAFTYRLTIRGAPRARVHLSASGAATGWIAAFCTARLCAPFDTTLTLDTRGVAVLQFELLPDGKGAARRSGVVTIRSDGGSAVTVPSKRR